MKKFMDKDFLLETETAKHLYHDYATKMPLVDYHCHIPPQEIYENRRFEDLVQVWLGGENPDGTYFGDHYKWRVMAKQELNPTGKYEIRARIIKNPLSEGLCWHVAFYFGDDKTCGVLLDPTTAKVLAIKALSG